MGAHKLTNVADPTSAQDAAAKAYIESVIDTLNQKKSVKAATTENIVATYSGTDTLTVTSTGVFVVDGVTPNVNERVLVKDQTNGYENGIYYAQTVGDVGVSAVLKRTSDADTPVKLASGSFVFAERGATQDNIGFILTQNSAMDFTSVDNTFGQFTGASSITQGNGVSVNGDTISVNSDLSHVTSVGTLTGLTSNGDVNIAEHNGVDKGLKLNGTLIINNCR